MQGIDKIKNKILDDAKVEADSIIQKANAQAKTIAETAKKELSDYRIKQEKAIEIDIADRSKRILAVTNLDARKELLAKRQSLIDIAFENTIKAFENMPADEYSKKIIKLIAEAVESGTEELLLSGNDKKRLGNDFINNVNTSLKATGKQGNITLSDKDGDFRCGFVMISGGVEINASFEMLYRMEREVAETEVAAILFA